MTHRNSKHVTKKAAKRGNFSGLEKLETRQMFSASPVSFYTVQAGSTTQLVAELNASSEIMSVVKSSNGIQFNVAGTVENIVGNFSFFSVIAKSGDNTIVIGPNMSIGGCVWAGSGSDLLVTGGNNDALCATSGDDTLIAMGGHNDHLYGGWGHTSMWATGGNYYTAGTGSLSTHFFNSFVNTSDVTLDGHWITEPGTNTASTFTGTWQNYAGNPLFSNAGPLMTDIVQGQCGDCYFVSALASAARVNPQGVRDMITPLGDGTFIAQFFDSNGQAHYVREDGYLPTIAVTPTNTIPFYAQLGAQGSTWVALMEKGWAYYESSENDAAPDYHYPDQGGNALMALTALGGQSISTPSVTDFSSTYYFAGWVNWELDLGKGVEIGFHNKINGILEDDHEYTVVGSTFDQNGNISGFWIRNPWGIDFQNSSGQNVMASQGHNDGKDDGMVWVSASMAFGDADDLGAATL